MLEWIVNLFRSLVRLFTGRPARDGAAMAPGPLPREVPMHVETRGELSELGQFVLGLRDNPAWQTNPEGVIDQSGLSDGDKQALRTALSSGPQALTALIVKQSGGPGEKVWICIWIRPIRQT
jgi:hypothetical protein